ncbi:sensor domain-containing diguanylate cyclase [Sphingopyxis sp. MWB1]|uniref:sensor domain-containing diguanylate cyclase n=1 Tax=Sphingopyxis sp. MWB1 TaxID=1537715 RepID=UPI00051A1BA9|nr:sensor domain-containing diguanylate cyclase [Sphingopyxis sp. MWB1]
MIGSLKIRAGAIAWPLLTATGYSLLAHLSLIATKGPENIATIWPSSGYFLALLLLMPARHHIASFAAMGVTGIAVNMMSGAPPLVACSYAFANGSEAAFALWLLRRREPDGLSFMAPRAVGNFCFAALSGSFLSGVLATLLTGAGLGFFLSWTTTVALGLLIITPPIIILTRMIQSRAMARIDFRSKLEAAGLIVLTALAAVISFSQDHFPLSFLPYMAVVFAAYRLGPFGAASGILVVALIAAMLTAQGLGPIPEIEASPTARVFFLQFYLVAMLFMVLPLAALLVLRQRLAKHLAQSNRWLVEAQAAAHVGHWRVDLLRSTIQWSDQTYRIHGVEQGTPVTIQSSLACYFPEDAIRVQRTLARAAKEGRPFEYQGRIRRPDGSVRHVKSHGSIERDADGRAIGVFGTAQDVTQTVENARMLEQARHTAEQAANTDMLTGLPNRRHMLGFLDQALRAAQEDGAPLAVAILDIDHFKQVNDRYGHATGDDVIRRVGERARAALRKDDMVGRFGGEEYVCVFQGTSALAAELAAERVRRAIKNDDDADDLPAVTVSVGLAVYAGEDSVEELLHRADKALYSAKRAGRNRTGLAA